ncbi:monocarboxylate transporter 14-like [Tubulanus polymorphus]|uniref:monocarboxylate transporter 14-like n=1 Tax=Tubulanus polymorphus TaxID=672921 RepID=UPI003DA62A29
MPEEKSSSLETVIVILAGTASLFIAGGNYGDGILVAEWVDYFHRGSGVTSWLGTVIIGIGLCGAPVVSLLVKRFGIRKVFVIASIINASALTVTSFVYNFYLAIALRVVAGCGLAAQLVPYVLYRFPKHTAIAQAILGVSFSGGGFTFPFIINYCLKQYGWRGCCLIIGGIASQQCALGLLFRHWSNKPRPEHEENQEVLLEQSNGDNNKKFRDLHQLDLFKRKMFVAFVIHSFILHASASVIYVHIVSGSNLLMGISIEQARFTLSAIALANLVGRFVIALMTKHPRIDSLTVHVILNTFLAIQVGVIPFMKGYTAALAVSASIGFLLSGYGSLFPLILLDLFGNDYLYMSYAYSICFGGVGFLLGAPVAGWIYDTTGNYAVSFYSCAGLLILSVLILIPDWIVHIKKLMKTNQTKDHKETIISANYIASLQSLS